MHVLETCLFSFKHAHQLHVYTFHDLPLYQPHEPPTHRGSCRSTPRSTHTVTLLSMRCSSSATNPRAHSCSVSCKHLTTPCAASSIHRVRVDALLCNSSVVPAVLMVNPSRANCGGVLCGVVCGVLCDVLCVVLCGVRCFGWCGVGCAVREGRIQHA